MTLSDPLLKELKGHIAKLVLTSKPPFGDENETVFLLCHCIESVFLKGLIRHDGFSPWRTDAFSWFYQLVRKYHRIIPLSFKLAFEDVLNDPKTRTHVGKTRLLIRSCLKRKCLHIPIQFHVENEDYNDPNLRVNYCPKGSILGHEILCQIFCSLTHQLSHYDFNLDLSNSSFLDESWQIPLLFKAEFVPCEKLGLTLGFPLGFSVIADIIPNSLAAELSDQISIGDIMDEFNGKPIRNFYGSKIESLFRKHKSRPFTITFIKATDLRGQLYLPAIKLYRILGLDPEKLTYSKTDEFAERNRVETLEIDKDNESIVAHVEQTATTLIQGLETENTDRGSNAFSSYSQMRQLLNTDDQTSTANTKSLLDEPIEESICDTLAELQTSYAFSNVILETCDNDSNNLLNNLSENLLDTGDSNQSNERNSFNLSKSPVSDKEYEQDEEKSRESHERKQFDNSHSSNNYSAYYDESNPCVV